MRPRLVYTISFLLSFNFLLAQDSHTSKNKMGLLSDSKHLMARAAELMKKDTARGFALLRDLLQDARESKNLQKELELLGAIAQAYYQAGDYNRGGPYWKALIAKNLAANNIEEAVRLNIIGGNKSYDAKLYRVAFVYYMNALDLAQQHNLQSLMAEALEPLGNIYFLYRQTTDATQYNKMALKIRTAAGDKAGMLRISKHLAKFYLQQSHYDSASFYVNKAEELAGQSATLNDLPEIYYYQVQVLCTARQFDEARKKLDALHTVIQSSRDPIDLLNTRLAEGFYYLTKGEEEKSKEAYQQGAVLIKSLKRPVILIDYYNSIANAYLASGNYQEATTYLKKYYEALLAFNTNDALLRVKMADNTVNFNLSKIQIKDLTTENKLKQLQLLNEQEFRKSLERENLLMDSIVKSEKAYTLAVIGEKEKQTALNAALDRENTLKNQKLRKERMLKWGLLSAAILLLLAVLSILYIYQRQRKKNAIIQKQAADLEVLMKEIHHRVKNNLQIVSSLLDLQSHSITDAQAHEAVKEGKNRVQSMALIHQNLYSEGNIKGIRLRDYISNLLQALCDSYNVNNDKVRIRTQIDDLNLDVETMIPLGLTINELVSNSFKYAFRQKEDGVLDIRLQEKDDQLHLLVRDNGSGFPEGLDIKTNRSFGLKMIRAFAQKLKAKLDIYNDHGAVVEMKISKFKLA